MDKPPLNTLVLQRRGVGRWPVAFTTEGANPLRHWNPGWSGCSAARRPVDAVAHLPEAHRPRQAAHPLAVGRPPVPGGHAPVAASAAPYGLGLAATRAVVSKPTDTAGQIMR